MGAGASDRSDRDRYLAFAFAWADLVLEVTGGEVVFAAGATLPLLGRRRDALIGIPLEDLVVPQKRPVVRQVCRLLKRHGRVAETEVHLLDKSGAVRRVMMAGHCLAASSESLFLALRARLNLPETDQQPEAANGFHTIKGFSAIAAAKLKDQPAEGAGLTLVAVDGLEDACAVLDPTRREAIMSALGTFMRASSVDGATAVALEGDRFGILAGAAHDPAAMEEEVGALLAEMGTGSDIDVAVANISIGDSGAISEADLAKGLAYTLQEVQVLEGPDGLQNLAKRMNGLVDKTIGQFSAFRALVGQKKFDLVLQPIISLKTAEIHHYEALCRFHGGGLGHSPFKIINFAEETGIVGQFDLAMVVKVIDWLRAQPRSNPRTSVAVNVSGSSVCSEAYVDNLFKILAEEAWTSGKLLFEITESSRLADLERGNRFIQALRAKGYAVCLDDFGAGASSFQYLSALEVDVVKLDGSAVKNAQRGPKGRAFLTALTGLCRKLAVETVAEMVETPEALRFVRECGCDYAQGWLFGKPALDVKDFSPYPNRELLRTLVLLERPTGIAYDAGVV